MNWGDFVWSGHGTEIDLLAAGANSLNGALLARRPDHYRNWTVGGIIGMGLLMGLGGGITRDILLARIPDALTNPAYIAVAVPAAAVGYLLAYRPGQIFREGLFQFVTAFALVWYAIAGAQKATLAGLPVLGVLVIAVIAPTAGRWYVDVSSGVPPKHFVPGEWFVPTAFLGGVAWVILHQFGVRGWTAAVIAFIPAYAFRVLALWRGWEEPRAREPGTVLQDSPGPLPLARKLEGPSKQELAELDVAGSSTRSSSSSTASSGGDHSHDGNSRRNLDR